MFLVLKIPTIMCKKKDTKVPRDAGSKMVFKSPNVYVLNIPHCMYSRNLKGNGVVYFVAFTQSQKQPWKEVVWTEDNSVEKEQLFQQRPLPHTMYDK